MARFGVPAGINTQDPQLKNSANISMPGSAPAAPQLDPVQEFIGMQADQPVPEVPQPGEIPVDPKKRKQLGGNRQAAFVADIIRNLATQDQEPSTASVPDPSQLPQVV